MGMKKLKTKKDFGIKTRNVFEAVTQNVPDPDHEAARKFFLKSTSTRVAILYIMTHYFEDNMLTASCVYSALHPKFGSKSSFVNFFPELPSSSNTAFSLAATLTAAAFLFGPIKNVSNPLALLSVAAFA